MASLKPDSFVSQLNNNPGRYQGALVFGPNWDLVQRLKEDVISCFKKADSTVEIIRLTASDVDEQPGKLLEELQALSLFGSSKLIVFEAGSASAYKECVSAVSVGWTGSFLLVTAGDLKKSVAVRKEFEASPDLAAVVCYEQGVDDLAAVTRDLLQAAGLSADPQTAMAIVESVSGNAALLHTEVEKISTYALGKGTVSLDDVAAVCAENRNSPLDMLLDRTFSGQRDQALESLADLHADGTAASTVLVALANHFVLLGQMAAASNDGRRADAVVKEWRPPVFWKRQQAMAEQVRRLARQDVSALNDSVLQAVQVSRRNHDISWPLLERLVMALSSRLRTA